MEKKPKSLVILGSCVSRDILNFSKREDFVLVDYYARSSIASITSPAWPVSGEHLDCIPSPFQRKMVQRDVQKEFLHSHIRTLEFDALLIDVIDERFDLYEPEPGVVVTLSGELLGSGAIPMGFRDTAKWIASGSERHRVLWKSGISRLFAELNALGITDRVIVNKVFWVPRFEDGSPLSETDTVGLAEANDFLGWMYQELEQYVAPNRWMLFSDAVLRGNPQHQWGSSPVHYSDAYYHAATKELSKIVASIDVSSTATLDHIDNTLIANVKKNSPSAKKFAFFVFKDAILVHQQRYSARSFMRFDTEDQPGRYTVFICILTLDLAQTMGPPRKSTRLLSMDI